MSDEDQPRIKIPSAIATRELSKRYPGAEQFAVDRVSFDVISGDLVVLLGPSGCGKTTLLKMINRLIEPTSGEVYVNGQEVHTLPATDLRRHIGYVIQQVGLFPHMTVRENISLVPRLLGWEPRQIDERVRFLIEMVGLPPEFLTRRPRQLSGGEQQRVGLARALAADPPILLMDEPFAAVDAITRLRLQDELRTIHHKLGKSILFVTHDVDEAFRLADWVMIMRSGRIIQFGAPLDILRSPKNQFVRDLAGSENLIRQLALIPVQAVLRQSVLANYPATNIESKEVNRPTVTLHDDLRTVLSKMLDSGAGVVLVLGEDSQPIGEISFDDLRRALTDRPSNQGASKIYDLPYQ